MYHPLEARRRATELCKLLATKPAAGTNTLNVGHRPNLQDAVSKEFADVAEGEIVVFEPAGGQDFKPVARIPFEFWAQWSAKVVGSAIRRILHIIINLRNQWTQGFCKMGMGKGIFPRTLTGLAVIAHLVLSTQRPPSTGC
ncbi:MAG: hypothetical protein KME03_02990 [Aphanocapsa lilacina HA4352-LM1]|jgi:hypothetical protein|nr:hypothetical protein [Aphanocapsa lilacina HA4352-LM1]